MEQIINTNIASKETEVVKAVKHLSKELKKIKKNKANNSTTILSSTAQRELNDIVKRVDSAVKDSPLGWIPAKEKLFTTIGIEYTFLKRKNVKTREEDIVKKIIKLSDKRQNWNKKVHQDGPKVIEFASPVHKDWPDLLRTYRATTATAKKVGLVVKRHDEGSGGGHIHMGVPKHWPTHFRLKFLKILYLDIASRPYINWIFNEPIDDRNASSMLTTKDGIKFLRRLHQQSYMSLNNIDALSGKSFAARYDSEYDTIEFRGFDMVESEQMLEEYIEFINAYFRYIYNVTKNHYYSTEFGVSYYSLNATSLDKFRDKKVMIADFNKLLKDIGLNPKKYKKYISKNYDVRILLSKRGDIKMDYDVLAAIDFSTITKSREDDDIETECCFDECEYDNRVVTQPSGYLQAVLDVNGELTFVRTDGRKNKDQPKESINEDVAHRWTTTQSGSIGYNSETGEITRTNIPNPVLEGSIGDNCEDFEIVDIDEPQPAIIADETMEGVVKYVLGPGHSKIILGVPISNSSPNKFLIITKNADDSLTFKQFGTNPESVQIASQVQDLPVGNIAQEVPVGGDLVPEMTQDLAAMNPQTSDLNNLTEELSRTMARFRENGNADEARNNLHALLNRIVTNSHLS